MTNRKHGFVLFIFSFLFHAPSAQPQAVSPKIKTICLSTLTLIAGLGAWCCHRKKGNLTNKIKALESSIPHKENLVVELQTLQQCERSREFYKNVRIGLLILATASAGFASWEGWKWHNATPSKKTETDLALEQKIEILPGEHVTTHQDETYTVENEGGTFTLRSSKQYLDDVTQSSKSWLCHLEKLLEAQAEEMENLQEKSAYSAWYQSLMQETSKVITKIKQERPLNRKDRYMLSHFRELDYECKLRFNPRSRFGPTP